MNTTGTGMSPQFHVAAARAIVLLGSASQQLRDASRVTESSRDHAELFGLSLLAFDAAGNAWNFLSDDQVVDLTPMSAESPLTLAAQAHDGLLESTTAMDPANVLELVLEIGSVRQQLRHYVDRY